MSLDIQALLVSMFESNPSLSDAHITESRPVWVRMMGEMVSTDNLCPNSSDIVRFIESLDYDARNRDSLDLHGLMAMIERQRDAGNASVPIRGNVGDYRVRADLSLSCGFLSVVVRRLNDQIPLLESLGLPCDVETQAAKPNGLVLVTGPTGSGKSTTLASVVDYINRNFAKNILTIEDPIEYEHASKMSLISPHEIGRDSPSFLASLRSALRQDPDVVLLGEIRDKDTMEVALATSETGHLVLATLHTNSAVKTIERVLSFFSGEEEDAARNKLASVLNCIVSQSLIRKKNGSGRIMSFDYLHATSGIRSAINSGKTSNIGSLMSASSEGYVLMSDHMFKLVQDGVITPNDALEKCNNYEEMQRLLNGAGLLRKAN